MAVYGFLGYLSACYATKVAIIFTIHLTTTSRFPSRYELELWGTEAIRLCMLGAAVAMLYSLYVKQIDRTFWLVVGGSGALSAAFIFGALFFTGLSDQAVFFLIPVLATVVILILEFIFRISVHDRMDEGIDNT